MCFRPDATLVENMEGPTELPSGVGVEMDDVTFNPNLEHILQNDTWVNDAT